MEFPQEDMGVPEKEDARTIVMNGNLEEIEEKEKTLYERYPWADCYNIEDMGEHLLAKTKFIMRVLKNNKHTYYKIYAKG